MTATRLAALLLFLLVATAIAGGTGWVALTSALNQLQERGRADLSLASDRLVGALARYRQVAVLMADHPELVALAQGGGTGRARAAALLLATADVTGSAEIVVADAGGRVLASSNPARAAGGLSDTPYFRRAMQGALGTYHAQADAGGQRAFYFAAPIITGGAPLGAVVVKTDMEAVEESDWRGDPQAVFFTDDLGVVFVANRSELLFGRRGGPAAGPLSSATAAYQPGSLRPFIGYETREWRGYELWSLDAGPYLPGRALHLTQPLPVINMTGELLIDTGPAERIALLQAAVAGALMLAFGALLFLAAERRRALAARLALEAEAKAGLERRVAERTEALSAANTSLRREVAEREEAEAALKKAQADLVQAGKLSALGQMSAGISHELNQPLMAIRSFAENGEAFLARGKPETAGQNLARISELARRMGRIIRNLRAFARQESEPISDVDITAVIEAALELSGPHIQQAGVVLDWQSPGAPVLVRGGEVRLQQVMTNLISNAVDAMTGRDEKRLEIAVEQGPGQVRVRVRDTGPGIEEPEKIFDPFYTTKEVGRSEGMGLGLSISYGLVQSFGGAIRGRNHAGGGAIFTVELTRAGQEQAA